MQYRIEASKDGLAWSARSAWMDLTEARRLHSVLTQDLSRLDKLNAQNRAENRPEFEQESFRIVNEHGQVSERGAAVSEV